MCWVYVESEYGLWTVGFFDPAGKWHADTDHGNKETAAERVHYLNGGKETTEMESLAALQRSVAIWGTGK